MSRSPLYLAAKIVASGVVTSACALVVSFDHQVDVPRYSLRGNVSGLEQGRRVTLRINQGEPFESGNGPFVIPSALDDRADYLVTAETTGIDGAARVACDIDQPAGRVQGSDVTIAIECPSSDVSLTEVRIRDGTVEPAAERMRATLTSPAQLLSTGIATEVTAITGNSKANITIAGKPAKSGEPVPLVIGDPALTFAIEVIARTGARAAYTVDATPRLTAYVKTSSQTSTNEFGRALAIDGDTLAIGSNDASCAIGVGGDENNTSCANAGAVRVFRRAPTGGAWKQEAYVKPSNTKAGIQFGASICLRGDLLVVGAPSEPSSATGINGDQSSTATKDAGAAYVFRRTGTTWAQEAYVKRATALVDARFGRWVACEGGAGGEHLVVSSEAGADVEAFRRDGSTWMAAPPALATPAGPARVVAMDGETLVVGPRVYRRIGVAWNLEATIPHATSVTACFGCSVAVHRNVIVLGAPDEASANLFVGGAYVYRRSTIGGAAVWSLEGSLRAFNAQGGARFGASVAVEGDAIAIGDDLENSSASGFDGDGSNKTAAGAGAVYLFRKGANGWSRSRYVKAPNPFAGAGFGTSVAMRSASLLIGAPREASAATGIDGDPTNGLRPNGAAYLW